MTTFDTPSGDVGGWQRQARRNSLEPYILSDLFGAWPPAGFSTWRAPCGTSGFSAPLDILTTAPAIKALLRRLPGHRALTSLLTLHTAFVGSTVTEFATLPQSHACAHELAHALKQQLAPTHTLVLIKDLPCVNPLLSDADAAWATAFTAACVDAGFAIIQGMALAYLPIDFATIDEYLSGLSASRRKNIRRKLRSRQAIEVTQRHAGQAYYQDADVCERYYSMYLSVFNQSEVQFDMLSPSFFTSLLQTHVPGSVIMEYWHKGELLAFNICYLHDGKLTDKYIGFDYSRSREMNLYVVSWIVNLEYALAHHCTHYVAGCSYPAVKASLGARFTPTHHAIYSRHFLLRQILSRLGRVFEMDRRWHSDQV